MESSEDGKVDGYPDNETVPAILKEDKITPETQQALIDERDTIAMRIRNTPASRRSKVGTAFDLIRRGAALVAIYNNNAAFLSAAVVQKGHMTFRGGKHEM